MTASERSSATKDTIVRAAADLFAERGYKATTTRAIADRAGVNEVTIFRLFGTKRGVLAALGESFAQRMAGFAVTSIPDPTDTRGTLRALARLEVQQALEFGAVAMRLAMDASSNPDVAEFMSGGPDDNFAGLVTYLTQRQAAGDLRTDMDPRVMAEAFFALTSQAVLSRLVLGEATHRELDVQTATDGLFEVFMDGVRAR